MATTNPMSQTLKSG